MTNGWARYLVELYFDCKQKNTWPHPGGYKDQTNYTIELFDFITFLEVERKKKLIDEQKKAATVKPKAK